MNFDAREDLELERYARRRARLVDTAPKPDFSAPARRIRRFVAVVMSAGVLLGASAFAIAWFAPGSYEGFKRWVAETPVLKDIFDDEGDWQIPLP